MSHIDTNISPYLQQPLRTFQQVLEERARRQREPNGAPKPITQVEANATAVTPAIPPAGVDQTV